jgi:hypothetical protein
MSPVSRGGSPDFWSRWLALDIDRHDDKVNPEATWKVARTWYDRARELGFNPLLFDSNGRGGYHLLLIFDNTTTTAQVHRFSKWLSRDWKELGLSQAPEVFPKQETIGPGGYGNWLRLPGRHHTRDHYTRVWDGSAWLDGTPAIEAILATGGTPGDKIPAEATKPGKAPKPKRVKISDDLARDAQLAREALLYVRHLAGSYDDWLRIGMSLTPLGADGLVLWDDWSQNCPNKYEEGACERKWRTFTRDGGLTLGTLFHEAKANGWTGQERRNSYAKAKPSVNGTGRHESNGGAKASPGNDRPTIVLESWNPGDSLGKWTGLALEALRRSNRPPALFQRAGLLVRLRKVDADNPFGIEPLSQDALRGLLDRAAYWGEPRVSKKGDVYIKWGPPRMEIVKDFASLPSWDDEIIPHLESIVESPRFLPDGRLITTPGYHPEGRIYYAPPPELLDLDIPTIPRPKHLDDALDLIFGEYLCDFPFADRASKANALAAMLLPFVRMMIPGPTPLHMFEASTEGTGKGLLAECCAFPALGRKVHSTPQKEDEAEWRKAITSALMSGESHFFIDNLYNPKGWDDCPLPIDSANLASALTQPYWRDRLLGGNKEIWIKVECTWMATGNNVEWSKELARRLVPIRLVPPIENPAERTDFKHHPLDEWAAKNRRELLRACLILCQNWIAEDRPAGRQAFGSYDHYARVMGGILDAAPVPGFLENRPKATGKDRESHRWPALVEVWFAERKSMTTSITQIYDMIFGAPSKEGRGGGNPDLQVMFADILGDGKELSQKQRLGHAVAKQQDRVWAGHRIIRSSALGPNKTPLYRLAPPEELDDDHV